MSGRNATGYDYLRVAEIEAILVETFEDNGFKVSDDKGHPVACQLIPDGFGLAEGSVVDLHILARAIEGRLT